MLLTKTDHESENTLTSNGQLGSGLLMSAGAALLVVACCALLPLIFVGGTVAGLGAFLRNPLVIGAGIGLVVLALVASARRRRRPEGSGGDCCPPTLPMRTDHPADTKDEQDR